MIRLLAAAGCYMYPYRKNSMLWWSVVITVKEHVRSGSLMSFSSYSWLYEQHTSSYIQNTDHHQSTLFRKVGSDSRQYIVRGEKRQSCTYPLCFWLEGKIRTPTRSLVNHITLNHMCWAPGCTLWVHQQSETTLSDTGAVGHKKSGTYWGSQTAYAISVT